MLVFTCRNVWARWKPYVDFAMVWGFPRWGDMVTYCIGKIQHVPERERTPLLAEASTKGCGYIPCTMALVTHKWERGVPRLNSWHLLSLRLYHLVMSLFLMSDSELLLKVILVFFMPYVVRGSVLFVSCAHSHRKNMKPLTLARKLFFASVDRHASGHTVCSLPFFFVKWLWLKTGKVFRVQSYWINDILNYLLTSSHHLHSCVFLITKICYETSVLKTPHVISFVSISVNAAF